MPFKNPEDKKKWQEKWKKHTAETGYGKAVYANRKLRWENEKRLRQGIKEAIVKLHPIRKRHVEIDTAIVMLELALKQAPEVKKPMDLLKEDTNEDR